ncbi:MAG TPA: hypothetical protein VFI25_15920 [Planctomycetota bacterium]|jgi:hypothetical protein|nr:hypothetical protein [Planctomycetota bacterium]
MKRALPFAAVLPAAWFLLSPAASAQCATLGTPGSTGCGLGATSAPVISCGGTPSVGNGSFVVTATIACVSSPPLLLVGTCLPAPVSVPGPFGTNGFCGPSGGGCLAYVGPSFFLAIPGIPTGGGFSFSLGIPNDPSLLGATVCVQEANLCILFVGQCVGVSHALSITVL